MRALVFVALTACGGGLGGSTDVDPTLRFADRTDVEISRLVSAASGSEGFQAQAQVGQFDDPFGDRTDPCPVVVEDAAARTVTITGGCTTQDGTAIEGAVEIDNPLGWGELDYDFNRSSIYTFDAFALVTAGSRFGYDGVLQIAPSYTELDMDLAVDSFGVVVRSDLHMECSQQRCAIGNSGLELAGAGGALVSGSIAIGAGQSATGSFTLRGADTVTVSIANNCVGWQLDGSDRGVACP